MLCQSQCSPSAGSLCFRPPSIWVHQAGVSWSCPCRAGWGSGTRGSSRQLLQSSHSHPCPRGSRRLPACRNSHLGRRKSSELIAGRVSFTRFCPITLPWCFPPERGSSPGGWLWDFRLFVKDLVGQGKEALVGISVGLTGKQGALGHTKQLSISLFKAVSLSQCT